LISIVCSDQRPIDVSPNEHASGPDRKVIGRCDAAVDRRQSAATPLA
jgi:hypothetical protein